MLFKPPWRHVRHPAARGPHLRREKPLYPAGQEGFVQHAADGRPLPGASFEERRQEGAQLLGVVDGHGGVRAADDLQDQVLHVTGLELRRKTMVLYQTFGTYIFFFNIGREMLDEKIVIVLQFL